MEVIIKHSSKKDKKYDAIIDGKKTVSFGAAGASDYTIHKDDERKRLYLLRHEKNEDWNDPITPGALSRWILWNKKTLKASIDDFKKRFNL
jgi:L-rhamnose mutarotase